MEDIATTHWYDNDTFFYIVVAMLTFTSIVGTFLYYKEQLLTNRRKEEDDEVLEALPEATDITRCHHSTDEESDISTESEQDISIDENKQLVSEEHVVREYTQDVYSNESLNIADDRANTPTQSLLDDEIFSEMYLTAGSKDRDANIAETLLTSIDMFPSGSPPSPCCQTPESVRHHNLAIVIETDESVVKEDHEDDTYNIDCDSVLINSDKNIMLNFNDPLTRCLDNSIELVKTAELKTYNNVLERSNESNESKNKEQTKKKKKHSIGESKSNQTEENILESLSKTQEKSKVNTINENCINVQEDYSTCVESVFTSTFLDKEGRHFTVQKEKEEEEKKEEKKEDEDEEEENKNRLDVAKAEEEKQQEKEEENKEEQQEKNKNNITVNVQENINRLDVAGEEEEQQQVQGPLTEDAEKESINYTTKTIQNKEVFIGKKAGDLIKLSIETQHKENKTTLVENTHESYLLDDQLVIAFNDCVENYQQVNNEKILNYHDTINEEKYVTEHRNKVGVAVQEKHVNDRADIVNDQNVAVKNTVVLEDNVIAELENTIETSNTCFNNKNVVNEVGDLYSAIKESKDDGELSYDANTSEEFEILSDSLKITGINKINGRPAVQEEMNNDGIPIAANKDGLIFTHYNEDYSPLQRNIISNIDNNSDVHKSKGDIHVAGEDILLSQTTNLESAGSYDNDERMKTISKVCKKSSGINVLSNNDLNPIIINSNVHHKTSQGDKTQAILDIKKTSTKTTTNTTTEHSNNNDTIGEQANSIIFTSNQTDSNNLLASSTKQILSLTLDDVDNNQIKSINDINQITDEQQRSGKNSNDQNTVNKHPTDERNSSVKVNTIKNKTLSSQLSTIISTEENEAEMGNILAKIFDIKNFEEIPLDRVEQLGGKITISENGEYAVIDIEGKRKEYKIDKVQLRNKRKSFNSKLRDSKDLTELFNHLESLDVVGENTDKQNSLLLEAINNDDVEQNIKTKVDLYDLNQLAERFKQNDNNNKNSEININNSKDHSLVGDQCHVLTNNTDVVFNNDTTYVRPLSNNKVGNESNSLSTESYQVVTSDTFNKQLNSKEKHVVYSLNKEQYQNSTNNQGTHDITDIQKNNLSHQQQQEEIIFNIVSSEEIYVREKEDTNDEQPQLNVQHILTTTKINQDLVYDIICEVKDEQTVEETPQIILDKEPIVEFICEEVFKNKEFEENPAPFLPTTTTTTTTTAPKITTAEEKDHISINEELTQRQSVDNYTDNNVFNEKCLNLNNDENVTNAVKLNGKIISDENIINELNISDQKLNYKQNHNKTCQEIVDLKEHSSTEQPQENNNNSSKNKISKNFTVQEDLTRTRVTFINPFSCEEDILFHQRSKSLNYLDTDIDGDEEIYTTTSNTSFIDNSNESQENQNIKRIKSRSMEFVNRSKPKIILSAKRPFSFTGSTIKETNLDDLMQTLQQSNSSLDTHEYILQLNDENNNISSNNNNNNSSSNNNNNNNNNYENLQETTSSSKNINVENDDEIAYYLEYSETEIDPTSSEAESETSLCNENKADSNSSTTQSTSKQSNCGFMKYSPTKEGARDRSVQLQRHSFSDNFLDCLLSDAIDSVRFNKRTRYMKLLQNGNLQRGFSDNFLDQLEGQNTIDPFTPINQTNFYNSNFSDNFSDSFIPTDTTTTLTRELSKSQPEIPHIETETPKTNEDIEVIESSLPKLIEDSTPYTVIETPKSNEDIETILPTATTKSFTPCTVNDKEEILALHTMQLECLDNRDLDKQKTCIDFEADGNIVIPCNHNLNNKGTDGQPVIKNNLEDCENATKKNIHGTYSISLSKDENNRAVVRVKTKPIDDNILDDDTSTKEMVSSLTMNAEDDLISHLPPNNSESKQLIKEKTDKEMCNFSTGVSSLDQATVAGEDLSCLEAEETLNVNPTNSELDLTNEVDFTEALDIHNQTTDGDLRNAHLLSIDSTLDVDSLDMTLSSISESLSSENIYDLSITKHDLTAVTSISEASNESSEISYITSIESSVMTVVTSTEASLNTSSELSYVTSIEPSTMIIVTSADTTVDLTSISAFGASLLSEDIKNDSVIIIENGKIIETNDQKEESIQILPNDMLTSTPRENKEVELDIEAINEFFEVPIQSQDESTVESEIDLLDILDGPIKAGVEISIETEPDTSEEILNAKLLSAVPNISEPPTIDVTVEEVPTNLPTLPEVPTNLSTLPEILKTSDNIEQFTTQTSNASEYHEAPIVPTVDVNVESKPLRTEYTTDKPVIIIDTICTEELESVNITFASMEPCADSIPTSPDNLENTMNNNTPSTLYSYVEGECLDSSRNIKEAFVSEQDTPYLTPNSVLRIKENETIKQRSNSTVLRLKEGETTKPRSNSWSFNGDYSLTSKSQSLIESIELDIESETLNDFDPEPEEVSDTIKQLLFTKKSLKIVQDDKPSSKNPREKEDTTKKDIPDTEIVTLTETSINKVNKDNSINNSVPEMEIINNSLVIEEFLKMTTPRDEDIVNNTPEINLLSRNYDISKSQELPTTITYVTNEESVTREEKFANVLLNTDKIPKKLLKGSVVPKRYPSENSLLHATKVSSSTAGSQQPRRLKSKYRNKERLSQSLHNIFTGDDLETDIDNVDEKELWDVLKSPGLKETSPDVLVTDVDKAFMSSPTTPTTPTTPTDKGKTRKFVIVSKTERRASLRKKSNDDDMLPGLQRRSASLGQKGKRPPPGSSPEKERIKKSVSAEPIQQRKETNVHIMFKAIETDIKTTEIDIKAIETDINDIEEADIVPIHQQIQRSSRATDIDKLGNVSKDNVPTEQTQKPKLDACTNPEYQPTTTVKTNVANTIEDTITPATVNLKEQLPGIPFETDIDGDYDEVTNGKCTLPSMINGPNIDVAKWVSSTVAEDEIVAETMTLDQKLPEKAINIEIPDNISEITVKDEAVEKLSVEQRQSIPKHMKKIDTNTADVPTICTSLNLFHVNKSEERFKEKQIIVKIPDNNMQNGTQNINKQVTDNNNNNNSKNSINENNNNRRSRTVRDSWDFWEKPEVPMLRQTSSNKNDIEKGVITKTLPGEKQQNTITNKHQSWNILDLKTAGEDHPLEQFISTLPEKKRDSKDITYLFQQYQKEREALKRLHQRSSKDSRKGSISDFSEISSLSDDASSTKGSWYQDISDIEEPELSHIRASHIETSPVSTFSLVELKKDISQGNGSPRTGREIESSSILKQSPHHTPHGNVHLRKNKETYSSPRQLQNEESKTEITGSVIQSTSPSKPEFIPQISSFNEEDLGNMVMAQAVSAVRKRRGGRGRRAMNNELNQTPQDTSIPNQVDITTATPLLNIMSPQTSTPIQSVIEKVSVTLRKKQDSVTLRKERDSVTLKKEQESVTPRKKSTSPKANRAIGELKLTESPILRRTKETWTIDKAHGDVPNKEVPSSNKELPYPNKDKKKINNSSLPKYPTMDSKESLSKSSSNSTIKSKQSETETISSSSKTTPDDKKRRSIAVSLRDSAIVEVSGRSYDYVNSMPNIHFNSRLASEDLEQYESEDYQSEISIISDLGMDSCFEGSVIDEQMFLYPSMHMPNIQKKNNKRLLDDFSDSSGDESFTTEQTDRFGQLSTRETERTVFCGNPPCSRKQIMVGSQKSKFVSCNSCFTCYCSKTCKRMHWKEHRRSCFFGRISVYVKTLVRKCERDLVLNPYLKGIASENYNQYGRGCLLLAFDSPSDAKTVTTSDCNELNNPPLYSTIENILKKDKKSKHSRMLCQSMLDYDPEQEFIINLSIKIGKTRTSNSKKRTSNVVRCARISMLTSSNVSMFDDTLSSYFIRTFCLPKVTAVDYLNDVEVRRYYCKELSFSLKRCGVLLKIEYPEAYEKLCRYVEDEKPFLPIVLYGQKGGKNFKCILHQGKYNPSEQARGEGVLV